MTIQHGYQTFYRIWLISLLVLIAAACGGGGGDESSNTSDVELVARFSQQVSALNVSADASASSGSIASYQWDFGDGSNGTGKTVSHTYVAAGSYTVALTITDDKGATATQRTSISVTKANVAPKAAFTHSVSELVVSFDASGSSDSDGSIASYQWDFGDGSNGTGKTVSHTYVAAGSYTATLTVTDDKKLSASVSYSIQLNVLEAIHFTDTALELKIRQALREQQSDFTDASPITSARLANVTWLNLDHQEGEEYIQSLAGIDRLENLRSLNLYAQHISDLTPLSDAKQIQVLYFDENPIYSLHGLENLASLYYVSLWHTPIYSLSPLLNSGLGYNSGTLRLGYNCLFMGEKSIPKEQLLNLHSKGVVWDSNNDESTYSKFYSSNNVSCINTLADSKPTVTANFDANSIVYRLNIDDSAIDTDAKLHCNLFYDLFQQQARVADQSVACSAQDQIQMTRKIAASGRYSGKLVLTDGFGGEATAELPEMEFTNVTAQAYIRSVDWGQVVVSHNPKLIPNRDALLRVHVVSDRVYETVPNLNLSLTLNGKSQSITMVKPGTIPAAVDYENMDASYHAIVPASLMQAGLQATLTLDSGESLQLNPTFASTPVFYLTLVPMFVDGKTLVPPNISDMQRALRSFWPMEAIEIKQHAAFTPVAAKGFDLLYELTDLQTVEGDASYYYGIYSQEVQNDFSGVGWIGRPSAIGYDADSVSYRCQNVGGDYLCVMAHELGHNFGLGHVGCGTESGISDFPYDPSGTGSLGISFDLATLYRSSEYVDVMSYCAPQHVSDFSFNRVQDFLETNPPAPFPTVNSSVIAKNIRVSSGLLLSGSLQEDDSVTLKRIMPLSRLATAHAFSDITVIARSQSQGELTRYAKVFALAEEHADKNTRYFQVELPFTDLTSLTILRDEKIVYRQTLTAAMARKNPTVPQLTEHGAQVCVQWQSGEYDGVSLMHVTDAGQRTVLTMQNPQPSICLPIDDIPNGGHWVVITHRGLATTSREVER